MFPKSEKVVIEALQSVIHGLKRQNKEKQPTVGVTFIDEDDVVSEQIPPLAVPASSRKIQVSETESMSDENSYDVFESANVYRMDSLRKFCNRIHDHTLHALQVSLEVYHIHVIYITYISFYLHSV